MTAVRAGFVTYPRPSYTENVLDALSCHRLLGNPDLVRAKHLPTAFQQGPIIEPDVNVPWPIEDLLHLAAAKGITRPFNEYLGAFHPTPVLICPLPPFDVFLVGQSRLPGGGDLGRLDHLEGRFEGLRYSRSRVSEDCAPRLRCGGGCPQISQYLVGPSF